MLLALTWSGARAGELLPSHSPGRDCDNTVGGDLLCPSDGGLDAGGGEGARSVWMGADPVGRNIVADDHDRHVHGVRPPQPSVKSNSARPQTSAPSWEKPGGPPAPVLGASGVRWKVTGVAVGNSVPAL